MAKMLGRDMDPVERAALLNMTLHPGWKIFRQMMDQLCDTYTADTIKVDPADEHYGRKLAAAHMIARTANDVCASLVRSVEAHERIGGLERANSEDVVTQRQ